MLSASALFDVEVLLMLSFALLALLFKRAIDVRQPTRPLVARANPGLT
jgi:hypothetical protein